MVMQMLASSSSDMEALIPLVAITGGVTVALVAIISSAITKTFQTRAREESRREIAAYVAEGTISPEDATKMLNAGSIAGHLDSLKQKLNA
jgi:hypothetical protein